MSRSTRMQIRYRSNDEPKAAFSAIIEIKRERERERERSADEYNITSCTSNPPCLLTCSPEHIVCFRAKTKFYRATIKWNRQRSIFYNLLPHTPLRFRNGVPSIRRKWSECRKVSQWQIRSARQVSGEPVDVFVTSHSNSNSRHNLQWLDQITIWKRKKWKKKKFLAFFNLMFSYLKSVYMCWV